MTGQEAGDSLSPGRADDLSEDAAGRQKLDEAFGRFFRDHYPRVVGILSKMVGERSRAEDLAIEVFWKFYRHVPLPGMPGESGANPAGWLYRTATRLGIDSLRAEARRERYERKAASLPAASRNQNPLEDILEAETRQRVRQALAMLRPGQAQLLILRASGFSYRELASVFDVKPGSVGTMLVRSGACFRKRYSQLDRTKEEK
ncbi:MAG: sigma-70 family RNA polymerase sigma factor [Acidobacteriota bacterium]|nr:sigma-70 family RNA polymerase sigma factor [Acidobacteriota bacterium]